jgi:uncharacterized protein
MKNFQNVFVNFFPNVLFFRNISEKNFFKKLKLNVFFLWAFFCFGGSLNSQSTLEDMVKSIPNPRKEHGTWILDQSEILKNSGSYEILNQNIVKLEAEHSFEIAIAILPTIGDNSVKKFTTELFQHWGVGKKDLNNGVLILHVLDQRRIEIETGYGLEGILTDLVCARLLEERTVPYFSKGAYSVGYKSLIYSIIQILSSSSQGKNFRWEEIALNLPSPEESQKDNISNSIIKLIDSEWESKNIWRLRSIYFLLIGSFFFLLFPYFLFPTAIYWQKKYPEKKQREELYMNFAVFLYGPGIGFMSAGITSILYSFFGTDFLVFYILGSAIILITIFSLLSVKLRIKWEGHLSSLNLICSNCKAKMEILDSEKAVHYLENFEKLEQELQSMEHQVLQCSNCSAFKKLKSPGKYFSTFSICLQCGAKASVTKSIIITEADYYNGGLEELIYTCRNCNHSSATQLTTSRKYKSSDDRKSTSSQSKISEIESGYPSSSSDQNGDFGGGKSGGGGSGSNY